MKFLFCVVLLGALSPAVFSADLKDAVELQKKVIAEKESAKNVEATVARVTEQLEQKKEKQFLEFYGEVRKSGLKLVSPKAWIDEVNFRRQKSGNCCQISVKNTRDGGVFVWTDSGGMFFVEGFGVVSSMGTLYDYDFESTGKFSKSCKYQVSIGEDVRQYSCEEYAAGRVDKTVVSDMKDMLVKQMSTKKP